MQLFKHSPIPVDTSQSAYRGPLLDDKNMHMSKTPRRHYRIVFKELGEVARHSSKLPRFYFALRGSICALRAVFEAGYMHRDISPGNILLVERKRENNDAPCGCTEVWVSKEDASRELVPVLMDFEYVREIDDRPEKHKGCAGTPVFIALEVANNEWSRLYSDVCIETHKGSDAYLLDHEPSFHQHLFHDIESYTWMIVWSFFQCVEPANMSLAMRLSYGRLLYPGTKRDAWDDLVKLGREMKSIPPRFRCLVDLLLRWLSSLHECKLVAYRDAFPDMLPSVLAEHALRAVDTSQHFLTEILEATLDDAELKDQILHTTV